MNDFFGPGSSSGQKVLSKGQDGLGQVWISGYQFAQDVKKLEELGITGVCSAADLKFKYPQNFIHIAFDLDDTLNQDARASFKPAYEFIENARTKTNVLVHCAAGISRCSTLLIAYLMQKYGWTFKKSLQTIKQARQCCTPNSSFAKQLKQFEQKLGIKPQKE